MAISLDIQPLLDLLARPIGNTNITLGLIIIIILFFYIISQETGGRK